MKQIFKTQMWVNEVQWRKKGCHWRSPLPPSDQTFLILWISGIFNKIPSRCAPAPRENPGSASEISWNSKRNRYLNVAAVTQWWMGVISHLHLTVWNDGYRLSYTALQEQILILKTWSITMEMWSEYWSWWDDWSMREEEAGSLGL